MLRFNTRAVVLLLLFGFSATVYAADFTLPDRQWALLTLPANADGQTIETLFADDLPIDSLGSEWVVYRFDQEQQLYSAQARSDSLKQGEGFWIIQLTGESVTLDLPAILPPADTQLSDACASADGCFAKSLRTSDDTTSWAIAGAPFSNAMATNDIRIESNQQQCAGGCSLNDAGSAGYLYGEQWVYDSATSTYKTLGELPTLQPWQAFWISTDQISPDTDLTLLLPQPDSGPGAIVETHHESIPNPLFGSTFRVADNCKFTVQACYWDSAATWRNGAVPQGNNQVIVDGNVQIRSQDAVARSVGVYPGGKLSFSSNANTRLRTADLIVFERAELQLGTAAQPIGSDKRAEVVFRDLAFDASDPEQHLRGMIAVGGKVRVHGREQGKTFIRTGVEPGNGDSEIILSQSAMAAGWQIGDAIVLPTSAQCTKASTSCPDQTEDRIIESISFDGLRLTLNQSLLFDHPGARDRDGTLDFTPHVINKTRNVIFRSENPNGVRGHVLFHGRTDVDIQYAAFHDLGRTDIRDLGAANQKGRYPLHAHHLIGPADSQANGYQYSLVGNLVDFGVDNREQNRKWGISIHGSHFGLIERNVVDHASGAGIVAESGEEMGNRFQENFVVRIIGGNGERTADTDPGDGSKLGRAGTGYWFNGGGRNYYESNVVAAIAECVYCYGFKFDNVRNGELLFPLTQGSDPHMEGGEIIAADVIGLNNFNNNEAYAVPNGLTVWWECTFGDFPNDNCSSRLNSFVVWHHHRWGYHGYPVNNLTLENFVVRGDPSILSNRYESVTGLAFSDYMHRNLVIRNADIQNVRTGIQLSSMRHERGATGPDVGFNTIEDSYLVATEGVGVWAPASVNGAAELSPQTTVLHNVQFDYPVAELSGQELVHIITHDSSQVLNPDKMNQALRNDVWIINYNSAPGVDGDDLYIVPDYQGPSRCDNDIGQCATELTARYNDIDKGHIYLLR